MSWLTTDEKLLSQGKTCQGFFLYFYRNNWFPVGFSILDTNSYTFPLVLSLVIFNYQVSLKEVSS